MNETLVEDATNRLQGILDMYPIHRHLGEALMNVLLVLREAME